MTDARVGYYSQSQTGAVVSQPLSMLPAHPPPPHTHTHVKVMAIVLSMIDLHVCVNLVGSTYPISLEGLIT